MNVLSLSSILKNKISDVGNRETPPQKNAAPATPLPPLLAAVVHARLMLVRLLVRPPPTVQIDIAHLHQLATRVITSRRNLVMQL